MLSILFPAPNVFGLSSRELQRRLIIKLERYIDHSHGYRIHLHDCVNIYIML